MTIRRHESLFIVFAIVGACLFYGVLWGPLRPPVEPHPGLEDEALKRALRGSRKHTQLSYVAARGYLWGEIDGNGRRATDVYTGELIRFVMQPLPNTGAVEHAWPVTRLPAEARSDLHHMFTATGEARLARLNLHYGKVLVPVWSRGGSRSGPSAKAVPVFEVREDRQGDVARAMFYVATMYRLSIPDDEEKILRQWHENDPVSKEERERNDRVEKRQRSRNPFVDHPGLVKRISDF